ncbi:hypothetical protein, partial [Citrobacter koseri]
MEMLRFHLDLSHVSYEHFQALQKRSFRPGRPTSARHLTSAIRNTSPAEKPDNQALVDWLKQQHDPQ